MAEAGVFLAQGHLAWVRHFGPGFVLLIVLCGLDRKLSSLNPAALVGAWAWVRIVHRRCYVRRALCPSRAHRIVRYGTTAAMLASPCRTGRNR